jgi:secreted PhoX family phosphatase
MYNSNYLNHKKGNQGRPTLRVLHRNHNLVKYLISCETLGENHITTKVIAQIRTATLIVLEICTMGSMILRILFQDNKKAFHKNHKRKRKITHLKRILLLKEIIRKQIFHHLAARMLN